MEEKEKDYRELLLIIINEGDLNKLIDFLKESAIILESVLSKIIHIFLIINIDQADDDGNTPLNIACQNGDYNIVKALIRAGAELNTQNRQGNTPLHYAKTYDYPEVMSILVKNGANETIKNLEGRMPWEGI